MNHIEMKTALDLRCRECNGEIDGEVSRCSGRDPILVIRPCPECIARAEEAVRGVNLKALDELQAA